MMLYSKVVTIRDRQLEESKRLEGEWVDEQRRLDLMMEIERLKSLKLQEEREILRKQAQKKGSLVIIDQIKERELDRIKEQEMREREMQQMVRQAEQVKKDELVLVAAKKERAIRMMGEVDVANKRALDVKDQRKKEEKDLE